MAPVLLRLTAALVGVVALRHGAEAKALDTWTWSTDLEDLIVRKFLLGGIERGTYIDVGANHAVFHSNTKWYHWAGWNGVVVDPGLQHYWTHVQDRTGDVAVHAAGSDKGGEWLTLYGEGQIASLVKPQGNAAGTKVATVDMRQLCAMLDNHVDFLSLDVEGHELPVLKGNDFAKCRPKVIVIEIDPVREGAAEKRDILLKANYVLWAPDLTHGNSVYVAKEFFDEVKPPVSTDKAFLAYATPQEGNDGMPAGVVSGLLLVRAAANRAMINDFTYPEGNPVSLERCWHDKLRLANHQKHYKASCFASLSAVRFVRSGEDAFVYDCFSNRKLLVFGFAEGTVLKLRNCASAEYVEKIETVSFDVTARTVVTSSYVQFQGVGSVLLAGYTGKVTYEVIAGKPASNPVSSTASSPCVCPPRDETRPSAPASPHGAAHVDDRMDVVLYVCVALSLGILIGHKGKGCRTGK
eukprot:Rhum_TRINITY_DN9208_c0_g1::Rhum_TRINITY_DN9208_c0_g1_i1::g.32288::m.32288